MTVTLIVASRQPDAMGNTEHVLSHVPGQSLRFYLRQKHLIAMQAHSVCRLVSSPQRQRVKLLYVPQSGDRISLQPGSPIG